MQLGNSPSILARSPYSFSPCLIPKTLSPHTQPLRPVRSVPASEVHRASQGAGSCSSSSSRPALGITRATSSVDPLSKTDGVYRPGKPFVVHSPDELKNFLDVHKLDKDKMVILEAKSSHCRPCKKFASTYLGLAERFKDCVFLEVIGDESPTTRQMMVDMKVKSTPTFFMYRNNELLHSFSGIKNDMLKKAILERLKPDETGRDWVDEADDEDEDEDDD